jgi:hypothetical protein
MVTTSAAVVVDGVDGVPAENYDAGNRRALAVLLYGTAFVFPGISLGLYGLGRLADWSRPHSLTVAGTAVAVVGAGIVAWWIP